MTEETVETETLESLAEEINACVETADAQIVEAATLIRTARNLFDNDKNQTGTWEDWAREHINLSGSRLRELLQIANAEDPGVELKRLRDLNKARQERHRKNKSSAPLRNDGEADSVSVTLDAERKQLIDWAQKAPLKQVKKALAFTETLGADNETSDPDQSEEEQET